nr:unnamed protein product [Callosobruchus chinensis]
MEYTNEKMADMHYVYGQSPGDGLEASRRYDEMYPQRQHPSHRIFPDFINDYENVVHSTKEPRIVVAIEK